MRVFFFLFIAIPIVEMALLISVGQRIGAIPTVALVFLTAAVGYSLLKQQGTEALRRTSEKMNRGEMPASEIAEGLFLAIGGALLLTPGFITDAVGFFCLIPGLRSILVAWGMRNFIRIRTPEPPADSGDTIDGEFHREQDSKPTITSKK